MASEPEPKPVAWRTLTESTRQKTTWKYVTELPMTQDAIWEPVFSEAALLAAEQRGRDAERERCAKIAEEHLGRIPNHHPDRPAPDDLAQGYGNASTNIAAAIRKGE